MTTPIYYNGDVVLYPYPYADFGRGKIRPALVMSSSQYQSRFGDILLMQITSKSSKARPQYFLKNWEKLGLDRPSYLRLVNLNHVRAEKIHMRIGKFEKEEYQKILSLFISLVAYER